MADSDIFDWVELGLDFYNAVQSEDSNDNQRDFVQQGFNLQNPWAASGSQGIVGAGLMNLLNNPGAITQTPGYQFAYDQGLQALFAKQAAAGNRFSGRSMIEAMQYGQGLASQMWGSEIDRYGRMAGAFAPVSGGIETGQALASLEDQQSFNQGYFLNNIFDLFETTFGGEDTEETATNDTSYDPMNDPNWFI